MRRSRYLALSLAAAAATLLVGVRIPAASLKFYPDDPIRHDPETQDASRVKPLKASATHDFLAQTFLGAGDRAQLQAVNLNTLDEVPDSSWFTNRIGVQPLTIDDIARGPDQGNGPASGAWTVTAGKNEGVQPGFTITDVRGDRYFVKLDPPANPEMASGAEVISTKFFHAAGYNVPENYIAAFRREDLKIAPGAMMEEPDGREHLIREKDIDRVLSQAARSSDGTYRVMASKALPGKPVGPFRYQGTRPDDPNDIFPHEHRRELRGMRVFAAWLNHDASTSLNSLDTLVESGGRMIVRHHLLDFGATLGSGSVAAQSRRAGNEYVWDARPALVTMLTLGFYVRPWLKIEYPDLPSVGRIEADYFEPDLWKPQYSNPAFQNARVDDTFWAARRVMAFSDAAIAAVVRTARFTDKRAEDYLVGVLVKRRDKIGRRWLNGVNPLVEFRIDDAGLLTFQNAAVDAGAAEAPAGYKVRWSIFDNTTGETSETTQDDLVSEPRAQVPPALLTGSPSFLIAEVVCQSDRSEWKNPVRAYFRRTNTGWGTVGLERPVEPPAIQKRKVENGTR